MKRWERGEGRSDNVSFCCPRPRGEFSLAESGRAVGHSELTAWWALLVWEVEAQEKRADCWLFFWNGILPDLQGFCSWCFWYMIWEVGNGQEGQRPLGLQHVLDSWFGQVSCLVGILNMSRGLGIECLTSGASPWNLRKRSTHITLRTLLVRVWLLSTATTYHKTPPSVPPLVLGLSADLCVCWLRNIF